jgi:hypothetical protein
MRFYLRLVGLLAKFTEYGHRTRINFVPLNWLLVISPLFFIVLAMGMRLNYSFQSSQVISQFGVDDTFSSFERRPYFEIHGKLLSHAQIVEEDQGNIKRAWAPLTDTKSQKIIYVERDQALPEEENATETSVQGTLRELDGKLKEEIVSSLRNSLSLTQEDIDSSVNLQYVVISEEPPVVSVFNFVAFFVLLFLFLFILTQTFSLKKSQYLVFQKEPGFPAVNAEGDPTKLEMRASGLFRLHGDVKGHLAYTRSYWATLETGQNAIVTQVENPRKQEPKSIWGIIFRPGSISSLEPGLLFFGFASHPSIRVSYTDDADGKAQNCVLSFPNNIDRQIALHKMLELQAS